MGAPPLCTRVPKEVGVKNAGIPAPPARIRSARVPWAVYSNGGCAYQNTIAALFLAAASLVVYIFFLTCGVSSTSNSPERNCRSNSAFSPT